LAAIQTWPNFIAVIAMLGTPEAVVYFAARDPEHAGSHLSSAMTLSLMAALPFVAVGYLAMPLLLSAQSARVVADARWYLLMVPVYSLIGMPYNSLRGRGDFSIWNVLRIAPVASWLVVLVSAWLLERARPGFLAGAYVCALSLLIIPVGWIVMRRTPGPFWPQLRHWKPMLGFGLPCVISAMPQTLNFRLDQMLMAGLLPARLLGLYVVAVAWSSASTPFLNALGAVLFPRVASQPTREQQVRALAQGSRLAILASLVLAVAVMALTPRMMPLLFGAKFAAAIPTALVLVVAGAVSAFNLVTEEGLKGLGCPSAVMWAEFGGLAVTAVSLWLMLRPFEIMGAALASLLGYSAVAVLLVAAERSLTGYSLASLLCPTFGEVQTGWRRFQALLGAS
jgi:O-antigen/teichoic acid export membrane protein